MVASTPARHSAPNALALVLHHRWAVPVLAELHRERGAKFVTLLKRLGVGRSTLSRTLKALAEHGWVLRNPGHGHPMRPEYVLTPAGRSLGRACDGLFEALHQTGRLDVALRKWSLPVVLATAGKSPRRFVDLSVALPDVTPRALTQSLKALVEAGLIERTLLDGYPPYAVYALAEAGTKLLPLVRRLARALPD